MQGLIPCLTPILFEQVVELVYTVAARRKTDDNKFEMSRWRTDARKDEKNVRTILAGSNPALLT